MRIARKSLSFGPGGPSSGPSWISGSAPHSDVVLSTRARLARNLVGVPFPHAASDEELARVAKHVLGATQRMQGTSVKSLHALDVARLSDDDKAALIDSHLASVAHVVAGRHRFALVDDRHTVSVLVNEEDHLRIQVILPGLQPEAAWKRADLLDDALSAQLPLAFNSQFGYVTSSLANCGTGLRVSAMVHVPALALNNRLPATWHAAGVLGATVRGLYGEDVGVAGNIYQVSNSVSLGLTESQTVGRILAVATYLEAEEESARHTFRTTRMVEIISVVEAAQRQLREAATMTLEEGIRVLSALRLGYLMGLETKVDALVFGELVASLRGGAGLVATAQNRARDIFYEDTRRPALFRNRIRKENAASR